MSVDTYTNHYGMGEVSSDAAKVVLELDLADAEALHTWLLRANADGVPSLDEPQVSAALAALSRTLDDVHVVMNIRREMGEAGLPVGHLSDEQVRELGQRISHAVAAGNGSQG